MESIVQDNTTEQLHVTKDITRNNALYYNNQRKLIATGFLRHEKDRLWVTWCTPEFHADNRYINRRNQNEN